MGRTDSYITQGKVFARFELEGEPLAVTRKETVTAYRGKDWPTVCIRWKGTHRVRFGEEEFLAEQSMVFDAGPKLGITVIVTRQPEIPYTSQERQAGRARMEQVIREAFGCSCTWREER